MRPVDLIYVGLMLLMLTGGWFLLTEVADSRLFNNRHIHTEMP